MIRIAIIGAGPSGLSCGASALNEGITPTIFEMADRIGGVWGPDNNSSGAAWPNMKVNISRYTGVFPNYPYADKTPDFPTTQMQYDYLLSFANDHDLFSYIKFKTRVINITQQDKKWVITSENNLIKTEETFDAVIIASGKFSLPFIPQFKGLEEVKNKIHSSQFKFAKEFKNKKVLVIGGSLSGTAIAEELAEVTEKENPVTHLISTERWVIPRYLSIDPINNGPYLPRDILKSYSESQKTLTQEEQYQYFLKHCKQQNDFPAWKMTPTTSTDMVIADNYFTLAKEKKLNPIKGKIAYFTSEKAVLESGEIIPFDHVIFCTGYTADLNYLPENLRTPTNLYLDIFPVGIEGCAFIGMYPGARGAAFPVVKLQADLVCSVLCGKTQLPSVETMLEEIKNTGKMNEMTYPNLLAKKLNRFPDNITFDPGLDHLLKDGAFTPPRFNLIGPQSNFNQAIEMLYQTENYRRRLLTSHDKVPTLATLCLLKIEKAISSKMEVTDYPKKNLK